MWKQLLSRILNYKKCFNNGEEKKLGKESARITWPGPDQWYTGPLEVFVQSKARVEEGKTTKKKSTKSKKRKT